MKRAIIIMTKVPLAGTVKTRLRPVLSPEECAALAAAFLQDAFGKAQTVCSKTIVAISPFYEPDNLKNILHSEPHFIEQNGVDLGERMLCVEFAFERNSDAVVMMDGRPTFPAE